MFSQIHFTFVISTLLKMLDILEKYKNKLAEQNLCSLENILLGGIDDDITWTNPSPGIPVLEEIIESLNISSILFARPNDFLWNIICSIIENERSLFPEDTETRTFLHEIPIADNWDAHEISEILQRRKVCIVRGKGIVTFGIVSPEQAFVIFSSVCFACFVKFFVDNARSVHSGRKNSSEISDLLTQVIEDYSSLLLSWKDTHLKKGPFLAESEALLAMDEAGKALVSSGMVDSFFGNISYKLGETILISQTASSLDELPGHIDSCPFDNSRTNAITASSEFSAHKLVYDSHPVKAILHGHPRFSVIMSLLCFKENCEERGRCHTHCKEDRKIGDIPIIPGEVGRGRYGLVHTLPKGLKERGAVVYGHGLFTVGKEDYRDAFSNCIDIEMMALQLYKELIIT